MAKIPYVQLSSTINTQRLAINRLIDSVGDLALLNTTAKSTVVGAVNEVDSDIGNRASLTTAIKTSLVSAINEVDARLDSINSTQLTTPLVFVTDLTVADSARITNNLSVGGNFDVNGLTTLDSATIDGRLTLNGTMGGSVALDSSFTSTFIRPNTIANSQLIDKSITVNGVTIALGGSGIVDITDSNASAALARSSLSAVDAGGDGSFTYESALGRFTYTGPSASEVRAHFSAGDAIKISSGTISVDSAEIVNYASPIRALFSAGDAIKITSGVVSIDSAEVVLYRSPIRALFSGDSNINVNTTTGAITLDATIKISKLNADSATFTGVVNALDFNSTSDIKFKENVTTLENSINTLNNIRPVSFNWIGGNKSYGVIAQELENILPELVHEDKYGIKRVSYTPIIALLIDAIKAHEIEIQKLKNCQCSCK